MFFASDNWAGVHPDISANLARHADGVATAYGDGDLDRAVYRRFNELSMMAPPCANRVPKTQSFPSSMSGKNCGISAGW